MAGLAQPTKAVGISLALLLLVAAPSVLGQATPEHPEQVTTIVKNVSEVSLDLVARGKKNKPVLDLKAGDIKVTDNGSPVDISSVRLVTGGLGQRLITLVFDQLDPSAARNAGEIAEKLLKMVPESGFSFSVLGIDGRLRLYQGFTANRLALRTAIGIANGRKQSDPENATAQAEKKLIAVAQTGSDPSGVRVDANERTVAQVMLATLEESQRIAREQHSQPSLSALLALARTQRQIPGRKVVIYFAQGLHVDSNSNDMLLSIVGAANRAGVSIYPIDANPLSMQADQGMLAAVALGNVKAAAAQSSRGPTRDNAGNPVPQPVPGLATAMKFGLDRFQTDLLAGYRDPLLELAGGTGGAYIRAGDNLRKPLQQLIEDLNTYYDVSYVPPTEDYDGKFRVVAVKSVRRGLKIRSRVGYFALPPATGFGMRPFEAPLVKILDGPQLPTDLKFRAGAVRLGDLPDGNANALVVEVPISELEMRKDVNANLFSVHVAIVAQVKNSAGTVLEHFSEDIPRRGALEAVKGSGPDVVALQRHFIAAPGKYVLEVAVQDRTSGKAAAQRMDFEIPQVAAGPALSDLVLVRRTDPFTWESDPLEPLRYEDGRVVPDLTGQVSPDAKDVSFFFMVHPDSEAADQARLEMALLRNGEPVGRMPLQFRQGTGNRVVPYLASIQGSSLAPGRYDAIAVLAQGGKTVQSSTQFSVEGPELASVATTMGGPDATTGSNHVAPTISDSRQSPVIGGGNNRRLVITVLPASSVHPPTPDEIQTLVEGARKRAVAYSISLPNFTCVEMTDRSEDPNGNGNWRHKDSIAELLRYRDDTETRSTLAIDGKPSSAKREDMKGPISVGEFGGLLALVFNPTSKADFKWRETASLGSGTVQVLDYRVVKENATIALSETGRRVFVGFHGLVYIESSTMGVRRITLEADGVPQDFPLRSSSMMVDYDYVAIGAHDHLVPVQASVIVTHGRRKVVQNEIVFRNYKRFASEAKIIYGEPANP